MRTFLKFQKWWYKKGDDFIRVLIYFTVPFLMAATYFAGFGTLCLLVVTILFFIGFFQLIDWPEFKRYQDYEERRLLAKLKGL